MKRIFNVFLIVLVGLFAFVACSPQASFSDELVNVSILGSQNKTRSLVAENDFDIANVKVWKYTAEKADQGLATGATDDPIALTKDTETGSWMTKALSQGAWNFELFGYSDDAGSVLICSGTVENQTITSKSHNVKITVKPSQTATGAIKVKNDIKIVDEKGSVYSGNVYTMDYTVANSSSEDVTATVKAGTNVPSGRYKVTVVFTSKVNGEDYTAAKADKYINVYDNLTTTVSGTITETEQAAAIVAEGGMISATSESFEVAVENGTNKAEVSIPVASTPVGTTDSAKKTTVTFPAGALNLSSSDTSADVSLKVESTSIESTATSYSVETSEGVAVASFNFELVGAENAEFNGDDGVEITTYIAKGLGDDAVSIKYVGTSTGKAPEFVSYTSGTGELKFKVFHFSTYYVIAEDACIYNASKDMTYESIDRAVVAASEGDTLILLDCSKSNDVSDKAADSYNWSVIHNNCASAADGYWHEKSDSFDGGYGTKVEPYMIANKEQFQNVTGKVEKYGYYKVSDDYSDLNLSGWTSVKLHGSFDGNEKAFADVTTYLFRNLGYQLKNEEITLKNFDVTFNASRSGSVVFDIHNSGSTTFNNVKVHGKIEDMYNIGSYYRYGTANYDDKGSDYTVKFVNCKSDATLICLGSTVGGFVGNGYAGVDSNWKLHIDKESDYTGKIYSVTGNGSHYMGMYNGKLEFSNETENSYDVANKYTNVIKISEVSPVLGDVGYTVQIDSNASKIEAIVTAQLNGYEEDNTTVSPNMTGITMRLSNIEYKVSEAGVSESLLGKVSSAVIDNNASKYGYSIDSEEMTINVPGNSNYRSGKVRLTVTQYKSDGTLICTGTVDVIEIKNSTV